MASAVTYYSDINDMLRRIKLPLMKHPLFYITKFESHVFDSSDSEIATHDYFEINLSLGYDAKVSVGKQTENVLDYNLVFISPGQMVKWENNKPPNKHAIGYLLFFKPEFLLFTSGVFSLFEQFPFLNRNTSPAYQLTSDQKIWMDDLFDEMSEEYKRCDENGLEIIRSLLTIFLFKAKRILEFSTAKSYLESRADEITYQFENVVIQTKYKRQSIQYYAQQLNISPIYLSECIKKSTGKTAKQIIDEYFVLEAKSLLKQSSDSIAQIGYSLGFEDNSNFVKYFKKKTGLTPRQYRGKL